MRRVRHRLPDVVHRTGVHRRWLGGKDREPAAEQQRSSSSKARSVERIGKQFKKGTGAKKDVRLRRRIVRYIGNEKAGALRPLVESSVRLGSSDA